MCKEKNKALVSSWWTSLETLKGDALEAAVEKACDPTLLWKGHEPVGTLHGGNAFLDRAWRPLLYSFPDLKRQCHLFFAGQSNGQIDGDISADGHHWVTGTGFMKATFEHNYLGIPATKKSVHLRWGEFCRIHAGQIVEVIFLIDMIDLMEQVGLRVLPTPLGKADCYPTPSANDGCLYAKSALSKQIDEATTRHSMQHIHDFLFNGLNAFDQSDLKSMGMRDYFHPQVKWYGPGGIGACLNFDEFEHFHQKPWLEAYPDRRVQNLDCLFAEGHYSAAAGWDGVLATHTGTYLNTPATHNTISFNGLDWWKRQDDQYIENWVFVDMIHLFRQLGVDLMP